MSRGRLAAALGMVAGALALDVDASVHGQEAEPLEVSISGRPEVGKTLRAEVSRRAIYEYEWHRCRTQAPRQPARTKVGRSRSVQADERGRGRWIRVRVTARRRMPSPRRNRRHRPIRAGA